MFRRILRKKRVQIFRIPTEENLAKEHKHIAKYWENIERHEVQTIVPNPSNIRKALEINKGERILVFAGFTGEWANALTKLGAEVHYSDISPSSRKIAKEKYGKNFESIFQADAIFFPREAKKYDWYFSFEPFPLHGKGLSLIALRGLLCKKGLILVYGSMVDMPFVKELLKTVARVYGASFSEHYYEIEDLKSKKFKRIAVLKLLSNEISQKLAERDIKVLELIRIARNRGIIKRKGVMRKYFEIPLESLLELAKEKGIKLGKSEILSSLKRISKIASSTTELCSDFVVSGKNF